MPLQSSIHLWGCTTADFKLMLSLSMFQQDTVKKILLTFQPHPPWGWKGNWGPWGRFLFLGQIPYSVIASQDTTRIIYTHKQTRQDLISPILVKCTLQLSPLLSDWEDKMHCVITRTITSVF